MADYRTLFRPEARDELRKLPRHIALKILHKLAELEEDPLGFDTTPLVESSDLRRLRIGRYRVIYTVDRSHLVVWVVHVAHRREAYTRSTA